MTLGTIMENGNVAKYNRQNSNNAQVELGRSNSQVDPMLHKHKQCSKTIIRQISKNTSRMIKIVVAVSLIFNVLLIPALTAVSVLYLNQNYTPYPMHGTPDLICYPCGDTGGIPGVEGIERTSNGYCCAHKRNQAMERLIGKNILPAAAPMVQQNVICVEETSSEEKHQGVPHRRKPKISLKTAAHLILKVEDTKKLGSLKWSSQGTAFIQGGLEVHNSTIHVKKGGLYRIKSHFSFDSVMIKDETTIFTHAVFKRNEKDEPEITTLKFEKTILESDEYKSSDVDLIAKLREGDAIGVLINPTYRFLYAMDIANTLDIEKID